MDSFNFLLERHYCEVELPKIRKLIEELKAENNDFAKECRLRYLKERLAEAQNNMREIYRTYEHMAKRNTPYIERGLIASSLEGLEKEVKQIEKEISFTTKETNGTNGVTPEMIDNAREYPIENLIEVKRGKALCPFHHDTIPSFSIKNNRYHCFGCDEKGDVIDFVMKRDGLSFVEAVRNLGGTFESVR